MTQADKALAAVREYDRLMSEIAKNKDDIVEGLDCCDRFVEDKYGYRHIPDGKTTHISESFAPFEDDDGTCHPVKSYNTPDEIAEIIGDCEGCKKAYAAIQDRKQNRKKLGAIKRSMRLIGRAKGGS